MSKRPPCPARGSRPAAPAWRDLAWCVAGAILGALMSPIAERAGAELQEWRYEGHKLLELGHRLRKDAVLRGSQAMHRDATRAFERSWQAGVSRCAGPNRDSENNGLRAAARLASRARRPRGGGPARLPARLLPRRPRSGPGREICVPDRQIGGVSRRRRRKMHRPAFR